MTNASRIAHLNQDRQGIKSVIARFVKNHPNCTIDDIFKLINKPKNTWSGRLTELEADGIIYVTGSVLRHSAASDNERYLSTYKYEDCPLKRRERAYEYAEEKFQSDVHALLHKWEAKIPSFIRVWFNRYRATNNKFNQQKLF